MVSSASAAAYAYSGGLVGEPPAVTLTIMNSYWNTDAPQNLGHRGTFHIQSPQRAQGNAMMNPMGATDLTLMQLKTASMSTTSAPSPSGLPHSATDNTKAWNLGDASELPRG